MTPQDIFDLAESRNKSNAELLEARADFIGALVNYVSVIDPELDLDDDTIKSIEEALIEQEREIRRLKKPAAKEKASEDDVIKAFLKTLGF